MDTCQQGGRMAHGPIDNAQSNPSHPHRDTLSPLKISWENSRNGRPTMLWNSSTREEA